MAAVYIAGPMRGHPNLNFPMFDSAAARGRELGWFVFNPAELDREVGMKLDHFRAGHQFTSPEVRAIVMRDCAALLTLKAEDGDAIAMLPGWASSKGARAEKALAEWLGLRVLDAIRFEPLELRGVMDIRFASCSFGGNDNE